MFVTASSVGAMLLCTLKLLHYSYLLLAYCCRTIYTENRYYLNLLDFINKIIIIFLGKNLTSTEEVLRM